MSKIPENLFYTEEHEWIKIDGDTMTVGITDHAQSELGDIVFVSLPELGDSLDEGDSAATIEAVKTVAEVYTPFAGEVVAINESLDDSAAVINEDPYGEGWIVKIKVSDDIDTESLLSPAAYQDFIQ
ncbi:MAG: glycine cleavage system protein GcvH [Fibrobacter sp.]|nr:glycine cleavage system protein GcvH [Fibrobacter sp.]